MAVKRISVSVVDGMKPGGLVWDTAVKGFYVRCQAKAKTYGVYRRIEGRGRWLAIGEHGSPWTPDTARGKALEILGAIAKGSNPAAARDFERGLPTVQEACEAFLAEYVRPKRKATTHVGYEVLMRRHIVPQLGHVRIDRVEANDVERMHAALSATPIQANRAVAVLSKVMNWAERQKWRHPNSNPVRGLERFKERSRERFLSDDEIARLGKALQRAEAEGESPFAIAAIRLLVLTGCRKSEIVQLRWENVDLNRGLLLLPDSKTGKKAVLLNGAAIEILQVIPRLKSNPNVIAGIRDGEPLVGLHRIWDRIRLSAGLSDVRLHDLRHSFASVAAAQGGSLPMIGKLLGHSVPATTARYAHLAADPVRELTQKAGSHLATRLKVSAKP